MFYLTGPTGLIMEIGSMGNASTLLFDPNGTCVAFVEGTIIPQVGSPQAYFYVGAGYAPIIYDGYSLPVWTPPALPTAINSLNWATAQPFQYKGQYGYYTDGASGLIYCTHRYYDPNVGRWTSRDPSGLGGGVNVYEYCDGDPVDGADPNGLVRIKVISYMVFGIGWHRGILVEDNMGHKGAYSFAGGPERGGFGNNGYLVAQSGPWAYRQSQDWYLSLLVENYRGLPDENYRTMPVELCTTSRFSAAFNGANL